MVAKNPLQDFWAKRGGGRLFGMGGSTVIYVHILLYGLPSNNATSRAEKI